MAFEVVRIASTVIVFNYCSHVLLLLSSLSSLSLLSSFSLLFLLSLLFVILLKLILLSQTLKYCLAFDFSPCHVALSFYLSNVDLVIEFLLKVSTEDICYVRYKLDYHKTSNNKANRKRATQKGGINKAMQQTKT